MVQQILIIHPVKTVLMSRQVKRVKDPVRQRGQAAYIDRKEIARKPRNV